VSGVSLSVVSSSVTVRAPAKVNLPLGVGPLRKDGYHDLITVFQALSLYDDITVRQDPELSVHTRGDGAASGGALRGQGGRSDSLHGIRPKCGGVPELFSASVPAPSAAPAGS